jgi:GNAT superfamily N-acetyltransferase
MPAARVAQARDADAAVRVLRRSITELCIPDHGNDPTTLQEWLANKTVGHFNAWLGSKNNFCVVTELDGNVNGVGLINRAGEIQLCYVAPGSEGRGFGAALLIALEQQAREWGLQKLHLGSTLAARPFYEKHGYTSAGGSACSFGSSCCYPYEKTLHADSGSTATPPNGHTY